MGPLLQVLLSATGWRNTLRIFAGLLLIPTLAALAYCLPENRNKKEKEANLPKPNIKIVDFTVLQNPAFIILCVAMSTFMLGYFVPFIHLVSRQTIHIETATNRIPVVIFAGLKIATGLKMAKK